jgi:SAM-dependent methyltransferase
VLNDKLFLAPLENPTAILDVGTGTGIWAMDCADDYPGAQVVGIDLSPIQPNYVPPNLQFEIFDLEEPWEMPERFDLVHTRLMNGFSVKSWPKFYEQAFLALKAGGWVENQEFDLNFSSDDDTIPADSKVKEWEALWNQAVESVGMTGRCDPQKMAEQMKEAGFINVTVRGYKMPLGPWPKDKRLRESGQYNLVGVSEGLTGLSIRVFTQILGWSVEEMEMLLTQVRAEWRKRTIHSYLPIWVVYGQKPPAKKSVG